MRLNIDKLMIGFVMILAVCLYAPTILEDYKANKTTNEKVNEVLAEAPGPVKTTETVVLAAMTAQESIKEAVSMSDHSENLSRQIVEQPLVVSSDLTSKFYAAPGVLRVTNQKLTAKNGTLDVLVDKIQTPDNSELLEYVNALPVKKEIKPSLMAQEEMEKAKAVRENYENFLVTVESYYAAKKAAATVRSTYTPVYADSAITGNGTLTASKGVNYGPSGKETYYNLNMNGVVNIMESMGYNEKYWVREDGVKMYGDYVMVAADLNTHPRGTLVESSLGTAIVVDTGGFAASNPNQLDIATSW